MSGKNPNGYDFITVKPVLMVLTRELLKIMGLISFLLVGRKVDTPIFETEIMSKKFLSSRQNTHSRGSREYPEWLV
jgi:hypothetical protein